MTVTIEVATEAEGEALQRAWQDPETRAFIVVVGLLLPLQSRRARARVLKYVSDKLDEERA